MTEATAPRSFANSRNEGRAGRWGRVAAQCAALLTIIWGAGGLALAAGDAEVFDPGTQDTLATPKPKKANPPATPRARDPIPGTWDITEKGTSICSDTGTVEIRAKGGGYSGEMTWSRSVGPTSVSVRGNAIHLVFPWEDVLGNKVKTTYDGTLSADRLAISGTSASEWYDSCTFTMRHR